MNFADIFKAFLEVGLLGLCAIVMIIIFYENHKKGHKREDNKDDLIENNFKDLNCKIDNMVTNITAQNNKLIEYQEKHAEQLINAIIHGVTSHVPSSEENNKLTLISNELDSILQDILLETGASRASLVQYHNGGKGINQQAFLKMSMTNEKTQLGVKSIMNECKDQFRSAVGYFVNEIGTKGHCCIFDIDEIKNKDVGMYELMLTRNIGVKCGYGIHDKDGMIIAYVGVEFMDKTKAVKTTIRNSFKEHYREIERLLNL